MKSVFLVFLWLTISLKSSGQIRLKNDAAFKYHADSLLLNVGIEHPDFNKINFELRFWIIDLSRTNAHELFILQHDDKNIWHLLHYQICLTNDRYQVLLKTDSTIINWKEQWNSLINDRLLSLPDENKVRKKWRSSKQLITIMGDGTLYVFELATKKGKRKYAYINPDVNLRNYDLRHAGLIEVNNIIDVFETQFKFKEYLSICRR